LALPPPIPPLPPGSGINHSPGPLTNVLWTPHETEQDEFSPERVYRFDKYQGRTHTTSLKIPEFFRSQIETIVRECSEYQTYSDFGRDAFYQRIRWFDKDGGIKRSPRFISIEYSQQKFAEAQYHADCMKDLEATTNILVAQEDWDALLEFIEQQERILIAEREPWRTRCLNALAEARKLLPKK